MSSIAEPFQRDELHLFMAVLLHLAAGLLVYLLLVTGERQPHSVMLEGLPIVFGKMISPGEQGGDAPKSLAKSTPTEAQQAKADEASQTRQTATQQRPPTAAPKSEAAQRQTAGTVAAKPPQARVARTAEPAVAPAQARPPATVALDSPTGTPQVAANVPTLRLQPNPDEAPREPPPAEAATAQQRIAASPAAEKAAEDAKAKLANVPGVKPAIVPQIDARQRVVVPSKQVEREPEQAEDPEVKTAEARRADEADKATAAARDAATARTQAQEPPAETRTAQTVTANTPPPQQTEPIPQAEASRPQAPATQAAAAQPPAAEAPVPQQRVAEATQPPAETTPAVTVPEQRASQPETVVQAQTDDQLDSQAQAAGNEDDATPSTGALPVPRQRAEEPERTDTATASGGEQPSGTGGGTSGAGTAGGSQTGGLQAFGKLSGLGAGKSGVPSGTSATGGALGQMQAEGSALAQTCLEQRQVFKAGDRIDTAFDVEMNRATRRLQVVQSSNSQLSRPRIAEIESALNGCASFKRFLIAQPGLTRFSLAFASGRR
jgi:hypothetical protein